MRVCEHVRFSDVWAAQNGLQGACRTPKYFFRRWQRHQRWVEFIGSEVLEC
jgi:hypothetical protein